MQDDRYRIFDPDGVIDAYSKHLGVNLLEIRNTRTRQIYQYNESKETRPTESKLSSLVKKTAASI